MLESERILLDLEAGARADIGRLGHVHPSTLEALMLQGFVVSAERDSDCPDEAETMASARRAEAIRATTIVARIRH